MKQATLNLDLNAEKPPECEFLEQMKQVIPWPVLMKLVSSHYLKGHTGNLVFSLETMRRVFFMQQWFSLSDPVMEKPFFDTPMYRELAQLCELSRLPDESTRVRFRHRLEKHNLTEIIPATINKILTQHGFFMKKSTVVHATSIAAHTSTKNKDKALLGTLNTNDWTLLFVKSKNLKNTLPQLEATRS